MIDSKKVQDMCGQMGEKAVETVTVWADANHRVLREMVELGAATTKESVRLYAELQQGAIDALRDSQGAMSRWQAAWKDGSGDPVEMCQKALVDSVDTTQKAFKRLEGQAQAMTRTAERLQSSAEQAGRGIQDTYTAVVAKMKDVYAQS